MPAPDKLWWSTDSYLYKHLYEPLSKHLCIVSPNLITALSFLMTFPILYILLEYNRSIVWTEPSRAHVMPAQK